jgi:hypothetical protein
MDINLLIAIIAAFVTVLGLFITQYLARRSDLYARKIPIYVDLLDAIQGALRMRRAKEPVAFKSEVTSRVVTWGSNQVVLAYAALRGSLIAKEANASDFEIKKLLGHLLIQIRKDLGHSDRQAPARFDELTAMLFFADL